MQSDECKKEDDASAATRKFLGRRKIRNTEENNRNAMNRSKTFILANVDLSNVENAVNRSNFLRYARRIGIEEEPTVKELSADTDTLIRQLLFPCKDSVGGVLPSGFSDWTTE